MSDDRNVGRRPSRSHDRDIRTEKHAAPEFIAEDPTGRYEGLELQRIRARRPTPERISRLEEKHDSLALSVAKMDGKLDTLVDLAGKADVERERRAAQDAAERERKRKHVIAIITAVGVAVAGIVAAGVV